MAITINSNGTSNLSLTLIEGIEQPRTCVGWAGSYGPSYEGPISGPLEILASGENTATSGTPYVRTTSSAGCNPSDGGLTGVFNANGFTGFATVSAIVTDAVGVTGLSNPANFNCISAGSFVVNAGPDVSISSPTFSVSQASATGGTPPYTLNWSNNTRPSELTAGQITIANPGTLNPTFGGLSVNGTYTFTLSGTATNGATSSDTVTLTRTGATPGFTMTNSGLIIDNSPTTDVNRQWQGSWSGGTPPYSWSLARISGSTTVTFSPNSGSSNTTFIPRSTSRQIGLNFATSGTATIRLTVTDNSVPAQSRNDTFSVTFTVNSCLAKGTMINIPGGTKVPVESLKVGDEIESTTLTKDNKWGTFYKESVSFSEEKSYITAIRVGSSEDYLVFNDNLKVTREHTLFYVKDNFYQFAPAFVLNEGDFLVKKNGDLEKISSIKKVTEESGNVYSISISPYTTYVANDYVVHNNKPAYGFDDDLGGFDPNRT
jgi:hypothetical protein